MKRLVIHPKDRSTDFLSTIYEDLDDVTLVTSAVDRGQLKNMIEEHDQVFMLGHGTPHGLLGNGGFIIDDTFAPVLAEKDNSVFVWCNADQYVKYNKLKGFHTGMFISEVGEAYCMGVYHTNQRDVDESNTWFVESMKKAVNDDTETMHAFLKHDYGELTYANPVAKFNHERLYIQ
jgi:hypothetical protein